MNFRTTCQQHNDAGFAEATYDEREDTCPRCADADEYEQEECCDDCQDDLASLDWEDAQTARAEGGYGYSGGWSGHEPAWFDG